MHNGSFDSFETGANSANCAFCQRSEIASQIIKETPNFLLIADHAPLVEGHLLIIPKPHFACYGAVPAEYDAELFALKHQVQQFLGRYYAPVVFWEHGIFRQTVFHAHLHCFPFGATAYSLSENIHSAIVSSQEDIRSWYKTHGQYFYLEDLFLALLFAPEMDRYRRIMTDIFRPGIAARDGNTAFRSPEQRLEEGRPFVEAVIARWREFEQQGVHYVNETGTR